MLAGRASGLARPCARRCTARAMGLRARRLVARAQGEDEGLKKTLAGLDALLGIEEDKPGSGAGGKATAVRESPAEASTLVRLRTRRQAPSARPRAALPAQSPSMTHYILPWAAGRSQQPIGCAGAELCPWIRPACARPPRPRLRPARAATAPARAPATTLLGLQMISSKRSLRRYVWRGRRWLGSIPRRRATPMPDRLIPWLGHSA
jgi:hypothetical protein